MKKTFKLALLFVLVAAMVMSIAACQDKCAEGHSWGGYVIIQKPTCTEKGTREHTCTVCGEKETADVAATGHNYVYTPISGQQKHSVSCSKCDYSVASEDCTLDTAQKCTKCKADYSSIGGGGDDEKHVCGHVCETCGKCTDPDCTDPVCAEKCPGNHGDVGDDYNEELFIVTGTINGWVAQSSDPSYLFENSDTVLSLNFPKDSEGKFAEFKIKPNVVGWDLALGYDDIKTITTDIEGVTSPKVTDFFSRGENNNIVCKYVCVLEISFAAVPDAYAITINVKSAESFVPGGDEPAPEVEYVVVGQGSDRFGKDWEELEANQLQESGPEEQNPNYYIKLELKQGDQFKVKHWGDAKWEKGGFGYGTNIEFGKSDKVTVSENVLFSAGNDNDGNPNDNIKVLVDCTVYLTIYKDNLTKMKIYIESVQGTVPEPTPGTETVYWLVGSHWPGDWGEDQGGGEKFTYHADTKTYTLQFTFKAGEKWQVKPNGTWDGQLGGSAIGSVTYADDVTERPDGIGPFTGSGDIAVNYDCTVIITITSDLKLNIHITAITVTDLKAYTYTFYLYAPTWSGAKIYMWEDCLQTAGWPGDAMTAVSGKQGWYSYSVTMAENFEGKLQNCILYNASNDNQRIGFEAKGNVKTKLTLHTEPMYFNASKLQQFSSAADAGAPTSPIASAPQQVAVVPQIVRKGRLAA